VKDSGNCFERVYNAMETMCGAASFQDRVSSVRNSLAPLRADDFPEHIRETFQTLREELGASESSSGDQARLVKRMLKLYTQAARLDGDLQDVIQEGV